MQVLGRTPVKPSIARTNQPQSMRSIRTNDSQDAIVVTPRLPAPTQEEGRQKEGEQAETTKEEEGNDKESEVEEEAKLGSPKARALLRRFWQMADSYKQQPGNTSAGV
jgi:hypothetical protein